MRVTRMARRGTLAAILLTPTLAWAACPDVPVPTVERVTSAGGAFVAPPSTLDLAAAGWVEEEFFLSGTATAFTSATPLSTDGEWTVGCGDTAEYKTRILVRRPAARRTFKGTVVVEWLNVSGGLDASPDWTYVHTLLMRKGMAWVGVSAQFVGVEGGANPLGLDLSLKAAFPDRYGSLSHPGDSFSYDIYSQVAQAIRTPPAIAPLADLKVRRIIAAGESQSASRLATYVNAVQPVAGAYDGFFIHSRGGGGAPVSQNPQPEVGAPWPTLIREDTQVPVLQFATESDLILLDFLPARQADSRNVRLWEVAGTAHTDVYQFGPGPGDPGPGAADTTHLPPLTSAFGVIQCDLPINAGPQAQVANAAMWFLDRWVKRGRAKGKSAPRIEVTAGDPPVIQRDALGNALGGIRTPPVDVPVSTLSGLGQSGQSFCGLFGTTTFFDDAMLAGLYPSHKAYVKAVKRAARRAQRKGHMLKPDVKTMIRAAAASGVGD